MRDHRSLILGAFIAAAAFVATPHVAWTQIRNPGDVDTGGRVLAKVSVAMTDPTGDSHPMYGVNVIIVAENGDRISVRTDAAGIATAWLQAGNYQFVTPQPLVWNGSTYSWDLTTAIRPGTGMVRLSPTNARVVSVPNAPAAPGAPAGAAGAVVPPPSIALPPARVLEPGERTILRVFADCQTDGCDLDFFRTEIPFVDYMRDRADASVHILVTRQATGGGGATYTVNFIGLRDLAGTADTLRYVASQSATQDDKRNGLARTIKLGLIRFVAKTPAADLLQISYRPPVQASTTRLPTRDPWNLWVFGINANANVSGETSQHFSSLRGSTAANRTSEEWKFRVSFNGGYNESKFTFSDGSKFASYSHSYGANQTLVKSLGPHWSAGERASFASSTFLNQKSFLRFAPAIEFSVFPYSEATRRQLTIQYSVGASSFRYQDTTIFNKISEVRPDQLLVTALDLKQPWGSVSFSIGGASFLDDFSQYRAVVSNSLDVRVFKGFSVNLYAGASLLRDQLYLAKGTLSEADILLRRRQLKSTYSFYGGLGLSYTFGSIYNNVVNPRFDLASGG